MPKDLLMSKPRIAINGLGRIGRLLLKILVEHDRVELVAINDIGPNDALAYLLKYDTSQGRWQRDIKVEENYLSVGGKKILSTSFADPAELPWEKDNIDIVVDCSGKFRKREQAEVHISAGAKKVIISAPADSKTKTIVMGINDDSISKEETVISNASCTTNCMAPMVKVLLDNFGIHSAIMNTIHAYTGDQRLQDSIHSSDWRRARAAAENIVPTSSNAMTALEWVMPEIKGKITGGAIRVPVIVGSLTELYCHLEKEASVEEINKVFKAAAEGQLKNILGYTEDPIVSSDIIHSPLSCMFDAGLTIQTNDLTKVVGWYDNEYGYTNRLAELVEKVAYL